MKKVHNETPDTASPLSTEQYKKMLVISLIKMSIPLVLCTVVFCLASVAWFAMNNKVQSMGTQLGAMDTPFELKTSGGAGLYDDYFLLFDTEYRIKEQTDGSNQKIIWQLSAQSHMDNYWTEDGTPTKDDLDQIKSIESSAYGLSPGDYGQIKFTIVPKNNSNTFSVRVYPETTCFKVGYYSVDNPEQGQIAGYQDDTFVKMDISEESDKEALKLLSGHLLFFYEVDTDGDGVKERQLIKEDGIHIENISEETEVVIYWVWPESLSGIIDENVDGLDAAGAYSLKHYFFEHPDLFLKKDENDDFTDITIEAEATAEEVDEKSEKITMDKLSYARYRMMYNEADQIIGTNVGYVFLEMSVEVDR